MRYRDVEKRLAELEAQESLKFAAFLLRLSSIDMRTWQRQTLETLAALGLIAPVPSDLWERSQPEKDAFLHMLHTSIGSGPASVHSVLMRAWHEWEHYEH